MNTQIPIDSLQIISDWDLLSVFHNLKEYSDENMIPLMLNIPETKFLNFITRILSSKSSKYSSL